MRERINGKTHWMLKIYVQNMTEVREKIGIINEKRCNRMEFY